MRVKRENWKGRYVYVVRDSGKIRSWAYAKGSKLTIPKAEVRFKKSKSLNPHVFSKRSYSQGFIVTSDKVIYGRKNTQLGVEFEYSVNGKMKKKTIYGYTPKGVSRKAETEKARKQAYARGIQEGLFTYDDEVTLYEVRRFYTAYT